MDTTSNIGLESVAKELGLSAYQIRAVVELLDEGNTIPFITRYRKDWTGGLDEQRLREIQCQVDQLRTLVSRKQKILKSVESQGNLTPELTENIQAANSIKRLEDLYLPFKPKKQTLATKARERGLEPLALDVLADSENARDVQRRAADWVDPDKQLFDVSQVLEGVGHLLAERFSERADLREALRHIYRRNGRLASCRIENPTQSQVNQSVSPEVVATDSVTPDSVTPDSVTTDSVTPDSVTPDSVTTDSVTPDSVTTDPTSVDDEAGHLTDVAVDTDHPSEVSNDSLLTRVESSPSESGSEGIEELPDTAPPLTSNGQETRSDTSHPTEAEVPAHELASDNAETTSAVSPSATAKVHSSRRVKRDKKRKKLESAFKDYFEFNESVARLPPHRILAVNRGERAGLLRVKIESNVDDLQKAAAELVNPAEHSHAEFLLSCLRDALARLILPSLERESRRELTDRAEAHAIKVFARNLRKLLLQRPVDSHRVLAIDPGFRSGCKLAALDEFGGLLGHDVIYIVGKPERLQQAKKQVVEMITTHQLSVVAIGNGTGCRESENLIAEVIAEGIEGHDVEYTVVNEAGASVYSTSPLGREEMADLDATQRSAVSIGRRLLDPLSELVKINPANIGVGLYQHDVKAKHLRNSLDAVVESCVNSVGVDVNSASPALLSYVSGLNRMTARRIYDYRREHGPFTSREAFKQVPGIGEAAFIQAAGFLKISGGDNPLDATWIHPESYGAVEQILHRVNSNIEELGSRLSNMADTTDAPLDQRFAELSIPELAVEMGIGELTVRDILTSLTRPRRDPREDLPPPIFRRGVVKLDDLDPGMELAGTILNVVDFGAFVDIGLHDSGLIHVSRLANQYVTDPHEVVSVGDVVKVWVVEVDKKRRRVSLTAVQPGTEKPAPRRQKGKSERTDKPSGTYSRQGTSRNHHPPAGKKRLPRKPRHQKPLVPITKAMEEGSEPMRTFGDLKQFYEKKPPDGEEGELQQKNPES